MGLAQLTKAIAETHRLATRTVLARCSRQQKAAAACDAAAPPGQKIREIWSSPGVDKATPEVFGAANKIGASLTERD